VTVNPWRSLQPLLLGCVIIVVVVVIIIIIILFESGNMADKHTNKRHTDRQIDSISKRKKKCNTRCTIKHRTRLELV